MSASTPTSAASDTAATTLAQHIEPSFVPFETLHERYGPMLGMVRELIGVVPNCDMALEVWPVGFRTYNLMVPNFLNLPAALMAPGFPKDLQGLAMYTSSRAASCAYCSAHTCSYALRRGATTDAVTGTYTKEEAAVVAVAEGLSRIPADITRAQGQELAKYVTTAELEWLVMSIANMGFLNKFMDAMGIELEPEALDDVAALIEPTGWSAGQHAWKPYAPTASADAVPVDGWRTYARVARLAPGAVRLEKTWTKGVPTDGSAAQAYLAEITGHRFAVLARMKRKAATRALATMLRENLSPEESEIGLPAKLLAGRVFAEVVGSDTLAADMLGLAKRLAPDLTLEDFDAVAAFTNRGEALPEDFPEAAIHAVSMARMISPSPSEVTSDGAAELAEALTPAQIVEVAVWCSVLQLLHRLDVWYSLSA